MVQKYTLFIVWLGFWVLGFCPRMVCAKSKSSIPDSLQVLHIQVDSVSFDMQRVDGGVFIMGGTSEQHREVIATDLPTHTVALDAYYIATTEVTQGLWQAVMKEWYLSDEWHTPSLPITDVNWYDCQEFIRRLDSITGLPFRLPTEAEWEFAARGGNESKGYKYAGSNRLEDVAWYQDNCGNTTHPVKLLQANELGLYDMSGNVYEWCQDWYGAYESGAYANPTGAPAGNYRVLRGGSWYNYAWRCRVSYRRTCAPSVTFYNVGMRLAL